MHTRLSIQIRKSLFVFILGGLVLFLCFGAIGSPAAHAQQNVTPEPGKYYTVEAACLPNGDAIEKDTINGPSVPPPGFETQRQPVMPSEVKSASVNMLTVPAFNWVFGCSAVSGAMIAAYYDRVGYSNIYTGPTDGGVMPLDNSSWPTWSDGYETFPSCPLIASKNGVDGRTTLGSIDDYWVGYDSFVSDPFIMHKWPEHAKGTAIGDYMKTSQSRFGNIDGETTFWGYPSAKKLTCDEMARYSFLSNDGTLGRKLFYVARGYAVTTCYNQKTDNQYSGGFSFAQFKAEIDAGRPVMINLYGHTVVGLGYDDATQTVYINDTWDYATHAMTWGGKYANMAMDSVSIVNISYIYYTITGNAGVAGATLSFDVDGVTKTVTSAANGNYSLKVTRGWSGRVTPSKAGVPAFTPAYRDYSNVTANKVSQTYKAHKLTTALSVAAQDGFVLESSETSAKGHELNTTATTLQIGDDAANKQYRAVLSFATGKIPDNAVITKITLNIMSQGIVGDVDPVNTFQGFSVAVKKGTFGAAKLEAADFQTVASKAYGSIFLTPVDGWYTFDLTSAKPYINKQSSASGLTQIRLNFMLNSNDNMVADYLSLYSGNADVAYRPQLLVQYYVP